MKAEHQVQEKLKELERMRDFLDEKIVSMSSETSVGAMVIDHMLYEKYRSSIIFLNQERKVAESCIRLLDWVLNDREFFGGTPASLP